MTAARGRPGELTVTVVFEFYYRNGTKCTLVSEDRATKRIDVHTV